MHQRTMLQDMGGPDAVPEKGDEIDMVSVLRELTLPDIDCYDDEEEDDGREDFTHETPKEKLQLDSKATREEEKRVSPKKSPSVNSKSRLNI